jgi:transmembrane sensor
MLKPEDKEKIELYIDRQVNDQESDWFDSLFLNGEDNDTLRSSLKKDWSRMVTDESPSEVNVDHILDRVHHIISKNENLNRQKPFRKLLLIYMKSAAILLLPLLMSFLGYYYLENRKADEQPVSTSIYAPLGARVAFSLPDSTTGMLNSGSRLTYTLPFSRNRHVVLEGEAWFDVKHDQKHQFEVTSGTSTVRVYGTHFNMSAYPEESYIDVVLEEGNVSYKNKDLQKEVEILPSERLIFENGMISKSVTDPSKYKAWTEGKLVFRGDPMAEVARRIERWYNVKIVLADKELNRYSFRGIFLDDSFENVLRFLSMTSPIRYNITQRKLTNDGTYSKQEVTIYLK